MGALRKPEPAPEASLLDVVAELKRIGLLLEGLPRAIAAASHGGRSLSKDDRAKLAILLPAISKAIGSHYFTARDLWHEAEKDAELSGALRKALGDTGALAGKKLGKLLARADGFNQDGFSVISGKKVREGMLWSIQRL